MKLIEEILSKANLKEAIRRVKANKGVAGVDKMTVDQIDAYFEEHGEEIVDSIMNKQYKPQLVKRVYIPKNNGKLRPLGIPVVVDRVIQQAIAQKLIPIYENIFSSNSYGFRPNRDCHLAIDQALKYLNDGCEWVIDLDIEKYFDTVNHDKLISILRENVNDSHTLHLIRLFLRAGIMDNGLVISSTIGMPQGRTTFTNTINIYLDKFDKELEERGLNFVRYADDSNIFVKSEMAANRVMKSVTSWLERKLFLKVSASKTKVVRPTKSKFLGFTFWKSGNQWKCKPTQEKKTNLYGKTKKILLRKKAIARPIGETFKELNQLIIGWINYFKIGNMKIFMEEYGSWLRHKVRVIIIKQWKKPKTIYTNLNKINLKFSSGFNEEEIYKVANSRLGWYKRCSMNVVNFILNPKVLNIKTKERPGLVNPLEYYLNSL